MADYDEQGGKLTLKLVYYGPAQSGKTTNLMRLHDLLRPEFKGDIMALETHNDRTLFFDLLPLGFRAPSGLLIKFKLFTVPGQIGHDGTRKAVLSRADGVVFVADSQRTQGVNNAESFDNLSHNTQRVGIDFNKLPLVVQFNKRDLTNILSEDEIRQRWGKSPWPLTYSSALIGAGVRETFSALLSQVYRAIEGEYALNSQHGVGEHAFVTAALGETAHEACA